MSNVWTEGTAQDILAFITLSEVYEDVFMYARSTLFYAMKCLKEMFWNVYVVPQWIYVFKL